METKSAIVVAAETPAESGVPVAESPHLQHQRAILEAAFHDERLYLLRVIESYLKQPNISMSWSEKREVALDVYTELFLEAMRTLEKFDASLAPVPWLLGLAQNMVLRKKHQRGQEYQRALQNVQIQSENEESDAEIFDRLTAASRHYHKLESPLEKQAALDEILRNVSDSEREILMLSIVHGLRSDVIGAQLGISAAAARKRLQRALETLRADYFKRFSPTENSATETL